MLKQPATTLLSVEDGEVIHPHPEGGWPEFTVVLRYFVRSEEQWVIEHECRRVIQRLADVEAVIDP